MQERANKMASVKTNDELHFIPPPVQTEFKTHYITPVQPLGTDRNASTITFKVANHTPNTFIDCSGVQLMVELERKHGNTSLTKTQADGIVNNIMHSLWEDVEVRLNHQLIERDNHLYPWKAFIQQTTTWTKADKELLGSTIGYQVDDDPDAMDAVAEIDAAAAAQHGTSKVVTWPTDGNALYIRNGMFLKGTNRGTATSFWLQGHLHAAPFNTNFIMPPDRRGVQRKDQRDGIWPQHPPTPIPGNPTCYPTATDHLPITADQSKATK